MNHKVIFCYFLLFFIITVDSSASSPPPNCNNRGFRTRATVNCAVRPRCGCPGLSPTCLTGATFCIDQYNAFPGFPKTVNTMKLYETHNDSTPQTCSYLGSIITVRGGETVCENSRLPTSTNSVLSQWSPSTELPARVTCSYFNPSCGQCCVRWSTNGCDVCP